MEMTAFWKSRSGNREIRSVATSVLSGMVRGRIDEARPEILCRAVFPSGFGISHLSDAPAFPSCRKVRCAATFSQTRLKRNAEPCPFRPVAAVCRGHGRERIGISARERRFLKSAIWWRLSGPIAQEAPVAAAFGALFAYESQVPKIASEKLNGLKKHYGADDRTCSYFAVHMKADVHHSGVWRRIISTLVEQDERHAGEALEGVSKAARALWTALDGIERERPNRQEARPRKRGKILVA